MNKNLIFEAETITSNNIKNYFKILQYPPCKRTIKFNSQRKFTDFPFYQIFFLGIRNYKYTNINNEIYTNNKIQYHNIIQYQYIYGSKEPLKSIDDDLYTIFFPHVNANGSICLPFATNEQDINKIAENFITTFWNTKNSYYLGTNRYLNKFQNPFLIEKYKFKLSKMCLIKDLKFNKNIGE